MQFALMRASFAKVRVLRVFSDRKNSIRINAPWRMLDLAAPDV